MKSQYLEAGKVVNTHGIAGEVKILPWVDDAAFLASCKTVYINEKPVKMSACREHKGCLLAKLEGCNDVNAAMALKNKVVYINRKDAKLPKGRFFISDIIGARVVSDEGDGLGLVADVFETPAHNIYVVKGEREILIPDIKEFILSVDVEKAVVTVHLIEGM